MQSSLCLHVGFMRSLWRLKDAKMGALSFADNASNKAAWMPYRTKQPCRAGALCHPLIFRVHAPTDLAQIDKGIVGLVSVYVVDLLRRPFASNVQPCELMRHPSVPIKHGVDIAIAPERSGGHSGLLAPFGLQVGKFASLLAVMRKIAQALLSNHVAPHQCGKSSKDAASGDESPVPRRVSCQSILSACFAKSSICAKIEQLSLPSRQQLIRHLKGRA